MPTGKAQSPKAGSLKGAMWCSVVCFLATSSLEEAGLGLRAEVDHEGGHGGVVSSVISGFY